MFRSGEKPFNFSMLRVVFFEFVRRLKTWSIEAGLLKADSESSSADPSEPFSGAGDQTHGYVLDVSRFQPIRAGENTHTSSTGADDDGRAEKNDFFSP